MGNRTRTRRLRHGAMLLVIGVVVAANISPVANAIRNESVYRSVLELRHGGPVFPADSTQVPRVGSRYAESPEEYTSAAVRRALEEIADLDVTGAGREKQITSLFDVWEQSGVPREELDLYRSVAPATFYGWNGQSDTASSATVAQTGKIRGWADFLQNVIPITENPVGRESTQRLQLLARAQNVQAALDRLAPPGGTLPQFYQDVGTQSSSAGAASGTSASTVENLDRIFRPSAQTQKILEDVLESPYRLASDLPYPHNPAALTAPDQQLPSIAAGAEAQRKVKSVAFGTRDDASAGGSGRANELAGVAPPGAPFSQQLIEQAVLDQGAARAAAVAEQDLRSTGAASQFFGGTAGGLDALFPNFSGLASNLFRGGSGTGGGGTPLPPRLSDIPVQDHARDPRCDPGTAAVSRDVAVGAAVTLGLPPSTDPTLPWLSAYVPAQDTYALSGVNALTGAAETIDEQDFAPPDACVWVVSHQPPGDALHAVFLEDKLSVLARKVHLIVAP